jgi:surface antigen
VCAITLYAVLTFDVVRAAAADNVAPFGDARFFGSTDPSGLHVHLVGMASTPTGAGYWLLANDGGVFSFGDARFYGSTGNIALARPVVGMASTPTGRGYWLVGSDGGIFSFGDSHFYGSTSASLPGEHVVGFARTPRGRGYWIVTTADLAGGYPDWAQPCEHAPYAVTGYCTTPAGPYDWGPVRDTTPGWSVVTTHSPRGYSYRNCTDWVAWRLQNRGVPNAFVRGLGNGGQWAANAVGRSGVRVTTTPAVGDAAVQIGDPGHVAYVEATYSDGTILVSEYNKSFDGTYDTRAGTPAALGFSRFVDFG